MLIFEAKTYVATCQHGTFFITVEPDGTYRASRVWGTSGALSCEFLARDVPFERARKACTDRIAQLEAEAHRANAA